MAENVTPGHPDQSSQKKSTKNGQKSFEKMPIYSKKLISGYSDCHFGPIQLLFHTINIVVCRFPTKFYDKHLF